MPVKVSQENTLGYGFVPDEFLREGEDEYSFRFQQNGDNSNYRHLTPAEVTALEAGGNYSDDWGQVLVQDPFDPGVIRTSGFYGLVRLGPLQKQILSFHDFAQPEGIVSSRLISSDIGAHCSIMRCAYVANYIIQDHCILSRVDELQTTNHSKFGNGVVKEGEDSDVLVTIEIMNENGGRRVAPFVGMTPADAYLWGSYRSDPQLLQRFMDLTSKVCDSRRGRYGIVGHDSVIKGCRIIKDVYIGPCSYIKGANKLKNLSLLSVEDSPVQIGEGVELVNGIIGCGSNIFYGCKAVRFLMGDNCKLSYGARLIHSILGDNSTVSCCEMISNLIFPGHEQHHNNSFLIASLVMGQSNIAAGATVGSNHNSRGADGELVGGRGFWPALSSTLKHNSKFASYTLLNKGNYPNELFIELPFSLLWDNTAAHRREIMPAYWWMYNMYALERNCYKYKARDRRKHPKQIIETAYLAPDTANEIRKALFLLEVWTAKSLLRNFGADCSVIRDLGQAVGIDLNPQYTAALEKSSVFHPWEHIDEGNLRQVTDLARIGRYLLNRQPQLVEDIEVTGEGMENSNNPVVIVKPVQAYAAYVMMLQYYGITEAARYCSEHGINFRQLEKSVSTCPLVEYPREQVSAYALTQDCGLIRWENVGGQLIPTTLVRSLLDDVKSGVLDSWDAVHDRYRALDGDYPLYKAVDACLALHSLYRTDHLSKDQFGSCVEVALNSRSFIDEQVFLTRDKDYRNFFRSITYRSEEEQDAVVGNIADNSFINSAKATSDSIKALIGSLRY